MKNLFRVRLTSFSVVEEIAGHRTDEDFLALLEAMEFGDTTGMSPEDLREICIMSLQDLKPEEAAHLVLTHDLGARLKEGQIRNLAGDMLDEKLWEEYADMSFHEGMFHAGSLLYEAFPRVFPKPDAVLLAVEIVAANQSARESLSHAPDESLLVRLLADGMDHGSALHRLFERQLAGAPFPEASAILWIVRPVAGSSDAATIDIISSGYWLDPLQDVDSYESAAFADDRNDNR